MFTWPFVSFTIYRFKEHFRVSKGIFVYILNEIKDFLPRPVRDTSVRVDLGLCATLRFLAHGSYQSSVASDMMMPMDRTTFCKMLTPYLEAMQDALCNEWISIQLSEAEKQASIQHFQETAGFPGVIGCIDGTHVYIISPGIRRNEAVYINRRGRHSINVMVICDYKLRIRCIDARYAGSNHDSFVFKNSESFMFYKSNERANEWLLGKIRLLYEKQNIQICISLYYFYQRDLQ